VPVRRNTWQYEAMRSGKQGRRRTAKSSTWGWREGRPICSPRRLISFPACWRVRRRPIAVIKQWAVCASDCSLVDRVCDCSVQRSHRGLCALDLALEA
jgi:hypothetical protein